MAAATKAGPGKHRPTATSITDTEGGSEAAGAPLGRTVALEQSLGLAVLAIIRVLGHLAAGAQRRQKLIQSSRFVEMTAVRIFTVDGLPVGLSIVGGSCSDTTLIAVAAALTTA
jgi:hypothetical protein